MATGSAVVQKRILEDPLIHLPCTSVVEYEKGAVIYDQEQRCSNIYLVTNGAVKVSRFAGHSQVLLDIYQVDEIFGQSALLNLQYWPERATALERTSLMTWTAPDIEELMERKPQLSIAFLQMVIQRMLDLESRIESFSLDPILRRLARSLIRLADRFGSRQEDGSMRMKAFTHEMLSLYVGTSREVVTQYMNQFRRDGHLTYSRQGIVLKKDGLDSLLRQPA